MRRSVTNGLAGIIGSTVGSRALACARIAVASAALLKAVLVAPVVLHVEDEPLRLPLVPLPEIPFISLFIVWVAAGALLLLGFAVPLTGTLVGLSAWYTLLSDERVYSNHLLLLSLLAILSAASGGGRLLSRDHRVPGTAVFLMMVQISTVYVFAGLSKINSSFLAGEILAGQAGTPDALVPVPFSSFPDTVVVTLSIGAVVFEVALGIVLWIPRVRICAIAAGILLHLTFMLFLAERWEFLGFALLCFSTYPLFASWRSAPRSAAPFSEEPPVPPGGSGAVRSAG
ncbi:MAG: HTTM domain-containing protein [Nocardiopsaceae bacterium]|nr:HTTM domain-containing protein [Nocardiopsaceae bacterium]